MGYGLTIPFMHLPLRAQADAWRELVERGYTDLWSAETDMGDGFTPIALAATWCPAARLGTAIIPTFTRGPAVLAITAASLAEAAPGRFVLGIGSSSDTIVERWNGIPFEKPVARTRDVLRFLRRALAGEKVNERFETFEVRGFRLARPPSPPPPLFLAALRPRMLRLAGREADGAILNWLSADDVKRVVPHVHEGGDGREIVARIFVCPSEDTEAVRAAARHSIAAYLNVPVYRRFHEWLGRQDELGEMWAAWDAGDRERARRCIPDETIDALFVHGSLEACRAHIRRYVENGVATPMLMILPVGVDPLRAALSLAPAAPS